VNVTVEWAKEAGMRSYVGILPGVLAGILLAATIGVPAGAAPQNEARAVASPTQTQAIRQFTTQYCVSCHNARLNTGGLALDSRDFDHLGADAEVWEKVIRKVQVGMMPPATVPRPDPAARQAFVTTLAGALDESARTNPNPGRPALHRLNRTEYANAIHDLLDLDVDPTTLLPPDDSAYGFDNVADVLGVSATLMEQYVSAAGKVSSLAVGDPDVSPAAEVYTIPQDASQDRHVEGLPFGTGRRHSRYADDPGRWRIRAVGQVLPYKPRRASGPRVRAPAGICRRRRTRASHQAGGTGRLGGEFGEQHTHRR
jgi:mono/diheme cytochrome c family protein